MESAYLGAVTGDNSRRGFNVKSTDHGHEWENEPYCSDPAISERVNQLRSIASFLAKYPSGPGRVYDQKLTAKLENMQADANRLMRELADRVAAIKDSKR